MRLNRNHERAAMVSTIAARRLIGREGIVENPLLRVEDGLISSIESASALARAAADFYFPEATLAPAYLDIHIHGCAGHDVTEATPEALRAIGGYLATRGVGGYFPTTVTSPRSETLRTLSGLAREIAHWPTNGIAGARPLGIHLEGPFLSHPKRGVHTDSLIEAPSVALFEQFWQASEGTIRLMTIAPEIEGADELIAHAISLGVRCSMGHSNARACEAQKGFAAGARSATHTFNAMRAIDHREPGIAAYVLDNDNMFAEIICDGIHVDPLMVKLFYKSKGDDRAILVTDGMSATGMPDGNYLLGEMQVEVQEGRATSNGTLAGSVLTLDRGVRNFVHFADASLNAAVNAASRNPARLMGIEDGWGCLERSRAANITVLSAEAEVLQTFLHGRPVLS